MGRRKDDFREKVCIAPPTPHSYREYGVALHENRSISIYIRIKKVNVISLYFNLDPLDYYNNIYYLDI